MDVILEPLQYVSQLIGYNVAFDSEKKYRKAKYVVEIDDGDGILFYSIMTGECLRVLKNELDGVKKVLYEKYFFVLDDFDENSFIDELRNVLYLTDNIEAGIDTYTILTTTDCNARFFYCYQKDLPHKKMSFETVEKVVSFIERNYCKDNEIRIEWFGGEPLYNLDVINKICDRLAEKKIAFKSTIISNGFLFDEKTIMLAKSKWNLFEAQISLDGTESVYNKVKAFVHSNESAFVRVINNIKGLIRNEIKVDIRLNVDFYNVEDVFRLIRYFQDIFVPSDYLSIYAAPLFDNCKGRSVRNSLQRKAIFEKVYAINEMLGKMLFHKRVRKIKGGIRYYGCMAANRNSIMIMPDGYLGKCIKCTDETYVGHIDKDSFDENVYSRYERRFVLPECSGCPLYSVCYVVELCPDSYRCCKEYVDIEIEYLQKLIMEKYRAFIKDKKKLADSTVNV